ncbi:hypothetical protein HMPREF1214_03959 [Bacteroides sp. HPS0048]|uniref:hypothetical protein n=1 Tax=Bacteroides sp. HPS0048 TaxID=1078089 RepID=UPI0003650DF0|nr:hypothetical protein [Bacteroides sp. HPS0048]EOA55175.1 hypothetical protein HMPREF1214_03959 [Bacteroides sp. HPS0048]
MSKLKPRTENPPVIYVETDRREITTTDVTYKAMDMKLLKKYFPSIYDDIVKDRRVRLKKKGSKE